MTALLPDGLPQDGTIGFYYSFGWRPYRMTDEEWRARRATSGVGIKTNGIGQRTDYFNRGAPKPKIPYAGRE